MKNFKLTFAYRVDGQLYFKSINVVAKSKSDANKIGMSDNDPDNNFWFRKDLTSEIF